MKKVKLIMALLMATLIMTLICPVSAAYGGSFNADNLDDGLPQSANTEVILQISDGFIVTIPQAITLTAVTALNGDITYRTDPTNVNNLPAVDLKVTAINASKRVNVTISSEDFESGNWTLNGTTHTDIKVPYYLKADTIGGTDHIDNTDIQDKGNALLSDGSVVLCSNKTTNVKLHALVAQNPTISDNFKGTLTFTVKYEDNPDVMMNNQ